MLKDINIGGAVVPMRATASTPRQYRIIFKRDIFKDMEQLQKAVEKGNPDNSNIAVEDLTVFENVAYIMARQADYDENGNRLNKVSNNIDDWLDSFDGIFSIYEALPQILDLWGDNIQTTSESKKKIM